MANTSSSPILVHKHGHIPIGNLFLNVRGVDTSTAITETSHSTHALILSTTKAQSSQFIVQVFTYSYDGIVHTEAYVSDI